MVRDVINLFEPTYPSHHLQVELPDEPIVVRCDPLRMEQTLGNLVSNAIKYSPAGGEVRVAAYIAQGRAILSVSDQGIGISEHDLAQLWEPFQRTAASTELIPGVGLGLSIAKRIVEAHGGEARLFQ